MSEELKNEGMVKTGAAEVTPAVADTGDNLAALRNLLAEYKVDNIDTVMGNLQGLGVFSVDDLTILEDKDLREAGISLVAAKKMLAKLIGTMTRTVPTTSAPTEMMGVGQPMISMMDIVKLPEVPSEDSWLAGLKAGGVLKITKDTYVSAVRAAIADRLDIDGLLQRICDEIEKYAEENDETVTETYYRLREMSSHRGKYAEVFAIIGGKRAVSAAKRKKLIDKMKCFVWPAAAECFRQLHTWAKLWESTAQTNIALLSAQAYSGGTGAMLPPTVCVAPDVSAVRDSGDELRNAINHALSGVGPAAAAAIATDYMQVKDILEDRELPTLLGVASREQLFKKLGINVSPSLIRMENNLVQFILGMALSDTLTADVEAGYFKSLYQVGMMIDWAQLGVSIGDANADTPRSFQGLTGRKLDTF